MTDYEQNYQNAISYMTGQSGVYNDRMNEWRKDVDNIKDRNLARLNAAKAEGQMSDLLSSAEGIGVITGVEALKKSYGKFTGYSFDKSTPLRWGKPEFKYDSKVTRIFGKPKGGGVLEDVAGDEDLPGAVRTAAGAGVKVKQGMSRLRKYGKAKVAPADEPEDALSTQTATDDGTGTGLRGGGAAGEGDGGAEAAAAASRDTNEFARVSGRADELTETQLNQAADQWGSFDDFWASIKKGDVGTVTKGGGEPYKAGTRGLTMTEDDFRASNPHLKGYDDTQGLPSHGGGTPAVRNQPAAGSSTEMTTAKTISPADLDDVPNKAAVTIAQPKQTGGAEASENASSAENAVDNAAKPTTTTVAKKSGADGDGGGGGGDDDGADIGADVGEGEGDEAAGDALDVAGGFLEATGIFAWLGGLLQVAGTAAEGYGAYQLGKGIYDDVTGKGQEVPDPQATPKPPSYVGSIAITTNSALDRPSFSGSW